MIPFTLDRRTDTGVSNTTLAIWLFLASEVMLFGALFSAYALLRASAPAWPSGGASLNVPLGAVNTLVLLAMTSLAWRARTGSARRVTRALTMSSVCGLIFLAIKSIEYRGELHVGQVPSLNTFLAIYFTLTGLHALHVVAGLIANAWVISGRAGEAMLLNRARLLSLYWAFVDIIWMIMFLVLYV
jgi:heme/copper-type cytochrome/quinol oxidase subunit 3